MMSYSLTNKREESFDWNIYLWDRVFHLGVQYGWMPQATTCYEHDIINEGTDAEDWVESQRIDMRWGGGYFTNDGQWVNAETAKLWAEALDRALVEVPMEKTTPDEICHWSAEITPERKIDLAMSHAQNYPEKRLEHILVMTLPEYNASNQTPDVLVLGINEDWQPDPLDAFSGERTIQRLKEFIEFLKHGAFQIY